MKVEEIAGFVEVLLKTRFPNVHDKHKIDGDRVRKLNFACPICGDSEKKASKKRGNIFLDTGAYKCFNDGCMAYMTLTEFVSQMSKKYHIQLPSFILDEDFQPAPVKRDENHLISFLTSDTSKLINISDVINRFSLRRLDQVEETSEALRYAVSRNLTRIDDFGDVLYTDSSDNKIYIFNFDHRSGRLLGFAMRYLDPNAERKYIIKSYTEVANIFMQRDLDKSLMQNADFLNNYFNILNINFAMPISMTEGQFDSMFVYNCIATSGVTKAHSILTNLGAKGSIRIIFDKDKAGKNQMIGLIKQGYSVFLWNKVMADLKKAYSEDYHKILDIKDINNLFSYLCSKQDGYDTVKFNRWINQYFSESQFDLMYL